LGLPDGDVQAKRLAADVKERFCAGVLVNPNTVCRKNDFGISKVESGNGRGRVIFKPTECVFFLPP